jgi:pilus assembly protein CpaE
MQDILLSTRDDATQRAVSRALEGRGQLTCVREWTELEARLARQPASLALVDMDGTREALGPLEPLIRRARETAFVLVCDELEVGLVLKAMQIGARHCLLRSAIPAELPALFLRLREDGRAPAVAGRALTVLSAGGGCGGTTLSINLAEELRLQGAAEVLLVDMDRFTGAMATYLGADCKYGIADVLGGRRTIDAELIRSTATRCGEGLHLLASPASVDFSTRGELSLERLEPVLEACGAAFPWIVIDAPRVGIDAAVQLARASAVTFVVFQLSVVDVRITRSLVRALVERGIARERIRPVANRYHKRSLVTLADATEALDGMEPERIPNDFASAIRALDLGQPLARVAPRSPARKGIRDLATRLDSLEGHPAAA